MTEEGETPERKRSAASVSPLWRRRLLDDSEQAARALLAVLTAEGDPVGKVARRNAGGVLTGSLQTLRAVLRLQRILLWLSEEEAASTAGRPGRAPGLRRCALCDTRPGEEAALPEDLDRVVRSVERLWFRAARLSALRRRARLCELLGPDSSGASDSTAKVAAPCGDVRQLPNSIGSDASRRSGGQDFAKKDDWNGQD